MRLGGFWYGRLAWRGAFLLPVNLSANSHTTTAFDLPDIFFCAAEASPETNSHRRHCVCAQQLWHWRPRPSTHGKTAQAGARPSSTTAATAFSDVSDCKHNLNLRLQRGKGSRSYRKHCKHEHELMVSQCATRRRPTTYHATTTCIAAHRRRRQRLPKHTLHSCYTTNGSRQLVCSTCSGEAKAFCGTGISTTALHHPPTIKHLCK
jgi:hypothetical protein